MHRVEKLENVQPIHHSCKLCALCMNHIRARLETDSLRSSSDTHSYAESLQLTLLLRVYCCVCVVAVASIGGLNGTAIRWRFVLEGQCAEPTGHVRTAAHTHHAPCPKTTSEQSVTFLTTTWWSDSYAGHEFFWHKTPIPSRTGRCGGGRYTGWATTTTTATALHCTVSDIARLLCVVLHEH